MKQGQLLAVIVSPELDQQVANALATYRIAKITDDRFQRLLRQQVVPQQTADESHATMLADKAQWDSLRAQQGYERVTAPFDGVSHRAQPRPGSAGCDGDGAGRSGADLHDGDAQAGARLYQHAAG